MDVVNRLYKAEVIADESFRVTAINKDLETGIGRLFMEDVTALFCDWLKQRVNLAEDPKCCDDLYDYLNKRYDLFNKLTEVELSVSIGAFKEGGEDVPLFVRYTLHGEINKRVDYLKAAVMVRCPIK